MKLCFATKDTLNQVWQEKLSKLSGVDVLWIDRDGNQMMTEGFKSLITERQ